MADRRRCTVFDNSKPNSDGKVIFVPANATLDDFIRNASAKLGIKGKTLYLEDGGEVDDINLIRDNDSIFVSCGEPFIGHGNGKAKSAPACPLYSIAVMGPGAVGKSAMTLQYVQGVFVMDYDPTIEDAYRKNTSVDGAPCLLDILDTAGQEDYTALRSTWMRERDGFILVFDVTQRSTFEDVQSFYDQLVVMHEDRVPPVLLAGNKADLNDRQVTADEARRLAATYRASAYIETSAKTGMNVDKAFATLIRSIRDNAQVKSPEETKKPKKKFMCTLL